MTGGVVLELDQLILIQRDFDRRMKWNLFED